MSSPQDWVPPAERRMRRGFRRTALALGVLVGLAAAPAVATGTRPLVPSPLATTSAVEGSGVHAGRAVPASASDSSSASSTSAGSSAPVTSPGSDTARTSLPAFTSRSARLEDVSRQPVTVRVDALGIDAAVSPAGVASDGQLEVPASPGAVVWYEAGSVPGAAGSAVLAGHVDYNGRRGVFYELGTLERGNVVTVELDDGTGHTFEVQRVERHAKRALPTDEVFTRNGRPVLTLITCGGRFDRSTGHYTDNVVVQAALRG